MNENQLDTAITACRARSFPPMPPALQDDVLRRIRNGADDLTLNAAGWLELILAPRTATALFAMALVTTLGVATVTTLSQTRPERHELAAQTLDFTTFTPTVVFELSR